MTARSRGCLLVVLLAFEFVVMVLAHGAPWRGEWNWTLDFAIGTTVLTGPIVGAYATWHSAEQRRRAVLVDSMPRGWLAPARVAFLAAGAGVASFVMTLGAALIATATVPHGGPFTWWIAGIVVPVFAVNAALGAAVGHLWPQRVLVVLVAPGLFVLGALAELGAGPQILRQGMSTGTLAGSDWNAEVVGRQALVMVGVVVVAVALQAVRRRVRTVIAWGTCFVGAALAVLPAHGLGSDMDDRFKYSDERSTVCAGTAPRVCLAPSNRRSLQVVSQQLHRVARPLFAAGAKVPPTYVQALPAWSGPEGSGSIWLPAEANLTTYKLFDAAQQIAAPANCPAWSADVPPPDEAFGARSLVSSWVMAQLENDVFAWSEEADHWLRTAPEAEQAAAVVGLFEHLRTCRLDDITLPWQSR